MSLPETSRKLLSVSAAAKYLGVSSITLRRWDRENKLKARRTLGNSRRYSQEDLDNFQLLQKQSSDPLSKTELTVAEAAKILGVTTRTLRTWEKEGKIVSLRDKNNYRLYDKNSVQNLTKAHDKIDHLIEPLFEKPQSLDKNSPRNSWLSKILGLKEFAQKHFKTAHFHIKKTHLYLGIHFHWYSRWHRFKYHPHIHWLALITYVIGVFTGVFLVLSGGLHFPAHATVAASVSKGTDTEFSQGTLTATAVSGSGTGAVVQLSGTPGPGGTQYKRSITVDNSTNGSILTDHQVVIAMDTGALVTAGKLQSNCADLRFNDADDTTALSYWVESGCNTTSTRIWVKIPTIAANATKTIYLYYGNPSASAQSSGANTFAFFDDFSGGSIDTAKWDLLGSGGTFFSLTSGELQAGEGISGWSKALASDATFARADLSLEYKLRWTSNNASYDALMFGWHDSGTGVSYTDLVYGYYNPGTGSCITSCAASAYEDGSGRSGISGTWTKDTQYLVRVRLKSAGGAYYEQSTNGGNTWTTSYNSSYSTESNLKIGFALYSGIHMIDDVRIRKWTTTEPATSVGSESVVIQPSGTWESPTNSNVMDLVWNGGWGDGTGGSTAFSATVANVSTNATVTFAMRVATTAEGLSGASYTTIGVANSGTTLTKTKTELDALGIGTGANRYVQVKATLAQTNGVNPQLDNFTINYLADNSPPDTNGTVIAMQKISGGATVASGGWANNIAPYFSWTAGSDSQSGIKGYCLYVGTDNTADPATTKGLLGTSPVSGPCPFIIGTSSIDFATASYRGSPWLTSSNSSYYLTLKAIDQAGNIFATPTQFTFKFDNTDPDNPLYITAPSQFVATKTVTVTWPTSGGSAPSDTVSGLAGMQYKIGNSGLWYGVNHSGSQDQTDLLDINTGQYITSHALDQDALQEGSNIIYFRTWDVAGNASVAYVNTVIKINTTSPSTPRNVTATPSTNTANSFAFSWIKPASFTGQESALTYCYTVNTLPSISSCSFTAAGVISLPAGAYATQPGDNTFYVVAKDEASNINYATYGSTTFTANTSAPGVPLNIDIADISVKATSNWKLAITWETPTDVGAGVANYKIYRSTDNSTFSEVASTAGVSYVDTSLTPVTYYYKVKACDSANNCGAFSSVVNKLPTGKFTSPATLVTEPEIDDLSTQKASITWATDRGSDSRIAYGLSSGQYFTEEVTNSTQVTSHSVKLNNLKAGTIYYYVVKWTDEDGNTGISAEYTLTTQPPPTIKEVKVKNVNLTNALVEFTAKDSSQVKIYYGKTTDFGGTKVIYTSATESTLPIELTGLDDGTKYFYKLNSFDQDNNEYLGNVYSFSTPARPRITDLRFDTIAGEPTSTMSITWSTNVPTTSVVTYQPAKGVQQESSNAELKSDHNIIIKGLLDDTEYSMSASGRDSLGNLVISDSNTFHTALDTRPPNISDVTVETAVQGSGSGSKAQLIVSWKTDEPSTSQVEFGEGTSGSYPSKTIEDAKLITDHIVIISELSPSKTYHVRTLSYDKARNQGISDENSAITGRASENVLDIILSSIKRSLGFLGNPFGF